MSVSARSHHQLTVRVAPDMFPHPSGADASAASGATSFHRSNDAAVKLYWDFRTEKADIAFTVSFRSDDMAGLYDSAEAEPTAGAPPRLDEGDGSTAANLSAGLPVVELERHDSHKKPVVVSSCHVFVLDVVVLTAEPISHVSY